jgi:hypothetical protein
VPCKASHVLVDGPRTCLLTRRSLLCIHGQSTKSTQAVNILTTSYCVYSLHVPVQVCRSSHRQALCALTHCKSTSYYSHVGCCWSTYEEAINRDRMGCRVEVSPCGCSTVCWPCWQPVATSRPRVHPSVQQHSRKPCDGTAITWQAAGGIVGY